MKAVVIIDLPDNVKWEEIEDVIVDVWLGEKTFIRKYRSMQRGVEIKPLPEKEIYNGDVDWNNWALGWNAYYCELTGEADEPSGEGGLMGGKE